MKFKIIDMIVVLGNFNYSKIVCNIRFSFLHLFTEYANYDNVLGVYPI